jgi:hypothetical protein
MTPTGTGTVKAFNLESPVPDSFDIVVNVMEDTPRWKNLSSFSLGPCETPDKLKFLNMENMWQYSKVFKHLGHIETTETDPKRVGLPTDSFFDWRRMGSVRRRSNLSPGGVGETPSFHYWNGLHLSTITARKLIYIPEYVKLAKKTNSYKSLRRAYRQGAKIALLDYDSYDVDLGVGYDWSQVINSERALGPAFVLSMMVELGFNFSRSLLI